jgi:hypothetical protein
MSTGNLRFERQIRRRIAQSHRPGVHRRAPTRGEKRVQGGLKEGERRVKGG